ncbi:MAG TPA: hypothetical protein VGA56_07315 [Opitutaceae bacterium]
MNRVVQPEKLDQLPGDHSDAMRSRRDLMMINRIMGNWRWLEQQLAARAREGDSILELGAGDGAFGCWLLRRMRDSGMKVRLHGLDLARRPEFWPERWPWTQADLLTYGGYDDCDVLIANLTLHHFHAAELAQLGRRLSNRVRLLLASEPARGRFHVLQARGLGFFGVNHVTRHDAPVSVVAGFKGDELHSWLGLEESKWIVSVETTFGGAYRLVAERRTCLRED